MKGKELQKLRRFVVCASLPPRLSSRPMGSDIVKAEAWIQRLESTGKFLVLRRFDGCPKYNEPGNGDDTCHAAALDLETTGLDQDTDAIIQMSVVRFTYSKRSGRICSVEDPLTYFEDPGRPIPPEITDLTGIADRDVAGERIDDAALTEWLSPVSLIIAHNAAFDRPFAERRIPALKDKWWACSMQDVPWKPAGMSSTKLEYLLIKRCNCFYGAHRADNDCRAVIHLLATPFDDGTLPMRLLLERARSRTLRLWAQGAPIELKDQLKARGYRWSPGQDGRRRSWYRDVLATEGDAEQQWLIENIFGGRKVSFPTDNFDARARYSHRV
jgi:DNA polymerase-3 subunit epsilon